MALWRRRPQGVILSSDHSCPYTSVAFGHRGRRTGVRPSMGSVGDGFDHALGERLFATLEGEWSDRVCLPTHTLARQRLFDYIEGFYNTQRRPSALGYSAPVPRCAAICGGHKGESE